MAARHRRRRARDPREERRVRQIAPALSSQLQTVSLGVQRAASGHAPALTPGDLLALQRHVGNRQTARLALGGAPRTGAARGAGAALQRYVEIDPASYRMSVGAKFISQKLESGGGESAYVRDTKEMTGGGLLSHTRERADQGFKPETAPLPPAPMPNIKYSSDGATKAMAIESTTDEPKVFYATDAVKNESNTKLEAVNAKVRIEEAGGTIQAPKDPSQMGGGTLTLKMLRPASPERDTANPNKYKVLDKFGEISECNSFIKFVLGEEGQRVAAFGSGAGHEAIVKEEKEPTQEIADFAANQTGGASELATHLEGTPSGSHDQPLPRAYKLMHNKAKRDRKLGINKGAIAEVGEGYVITSNTPMPDAVDYTSYINALNRLKAGNLLTPDEEKIFRYKWGYHYAGVVARVGKDTVTLENYNRGTVADWALDKHYNDVMHQYQAFRDFVRDTLLEEQRAGQPGQIPVIPKLRRAWFKERAKRWREHVKAANEAHLLINQQIEAALTKIEDTQNKGIAVANADLYHFKMYGAGAGQSFHEQWQGALSDPMTLRIRQSLPALKKEKIAKVNADAQALQGVGLPFGFDTVLNGIKSRATVRINTASTTTDVNNAFKEANDEMKDLKFGAVMSWTKSAAALSGKDDTSIPPQTRPDADIATLKSLIERWARKGWAIRKSSKQRLQDRRNKQLALRDKLTSIDAVAL